MNDRRIAVIGMAMRVPGADTVADFWRDALAGTVHVRRSSASELRDAGLPPEAVVAGAGLDDIDLFDAGFFGLDAHRAAQIDPQHRLFHEVAHHALEDAGYAGNPVRTGVYAGTGYHLHPLHGYLRHHLSASVDAVTDRAEALELAEDNDSGYLAARTVELLGLTGPAVGVQTGEATGLVAVHLAAQALNAGDVTIAVAGASAVHLPQVLGYLPGKGSGLSPTGVCRAFDAASDGTVTGNGVVAVVLKRLDEALADEDRIHAVILGTGPSFRRALDVAEVSAADLTYLETQGTGVPEQDRRELAELVATFREDTADTGFCAVGSAKPAIGHLDAAAGLAGFVRAVCAVRSGRIPPLANHTAPDPALSLEDGPLRIPEAAEEWPDTVGPRVASVNAFGPGGADAHVILAQPPGARRGTTAPKVPGLLPISASHPEALRELATAYADRLRRQPAPRIADVVTTAALGRRHTRHRLVAYGGTPAAMADAIDAYLSGARSERYSAYQASDSVRPVFAYTGLAEPGSTATRALYDRSQHFRDVLDEAGALLDDPDLVPVLLGDKASSDPAIALPAQFAAQAGMTALWRYLGVQPHLVFGHSAGELVALHAAGALSLVDGIRLAAGFADLVETDTPPGGMVAILADKTTVDTVLAACPGLTLAIVNGPENHVLAGTVSVVDKACRLAKALDLRWQRLPLTHAYHAAQLDDIRGPLRALAETVTWQPIAVPFVSGLDGTTRPSGWLPDAAYIVAQARQPVRFDAVLEQVAATADAVLLEIGPQPALTRLARAAIPALPTIPSGREGAEVDPFHRAVGELHCAGVNIDWAALTSGTGGRRVGLPPYPFRRDRHWIDAPTPTIHKEQSTGDTLMPVPPVGLTEDPAPITTGPQDQDPPVISETPPYEPYGFTEPPADLLSQPGSGGGHRALAEAIHLAAQAAASAARAAEHLAMRLPSPRPPIERPRSTPAFGLAVLGHHADPDATITHGYRFLHQAAEFADANGFSTLWLPGRPASPYAGPFPSTVVLAAALAADTTHVRLHAGDIVLPAHDTVRLAEEWSMVDSLSAGRVGLTIGADGHPGDFTAAPDDYPTRHETLEQRIDELLAFWHGDPIRRHAGDGSDVDVRLHPKPLQDNAPLHLAATTSADFERAGRLNLGVVTNLLVQSPDTLATNIATYRTARAAAHLDPTGGHVTVHLHTYLAPELGTARREAFTALSNHLRAMPDLFTHLMNSLDIPLDGDPAYLFQHSYDRYCDTHTLIGTPATVAPVVESLRAIGVDEIGAIIDFGLPSDTVHRSLPLLADLREGFAACRQTVAIPTQRTREGGRVTPLAGERWGVVSNVDSAPDGAATSAGTVAPDDAAGTDATVGTERARPGRHEVADEPRPPSDRRARRSSPAGEADLGERLGTPAPNSARPMREVDPASEVRPTPSFAVPAEDESPAASGRADAPVSPARYEASPTAPSAAPGGTEKPQSRASAPAIPSEGPPMPPPTSDGSPGSRMGVKGDPSQPVDNRPVVDNSTAERSAGAGDATQAASPDQGDGSGGVRRTGVEGRAPELGRGDVAARGQASGGAGTSRESAGQGGSAVADSSVEARLADSSAPTRAIRPRSGAAERGSKEERAADQEEQSRWAPGAPGNVGNGVPMAARSVAPEEDVRPAATGSGKAMRTEEPGQSTDAASSGQQARAESRSTETASSGRPARAETRSTDTVTSGQPASAQTPSPNPGQPARAQTQSPDSAWAPPAPAVTPAPPVSAYWTRVLADPLPVLALPGDRMRPATSSGVRGSEEWPLAPKLVAALRAMDANVMAPLIAGVLVTSRRFAGQDDLLVGVPVGDLCVPLRVGLGGDPAFGEVVGRVRAALGEVAEAAVDVPSEAVFQTAVGYGGSAVPGGLDLVWRFVEQGTGITCRLEYAAELFEAASVRRFGHYLRDILTEASEDPGHRLSQLDDLSDDDMGALDHWHRGAQVDPLGMTVDEVVAGQAARSPQAPAATHGGDMVTYATLEALSNQLAHQLRGAGVRPSDVVGVLMPRDLRLVVTLLAVIKSGAAYLPLDPSWGAESIAEVLADSRARLTVAEIGLTGLLPEGAARVHPNPAELETFPSTAPERNTTPDSPCYVIYDSRRENARHGVVVSHRSLLNLCGWYHRRFRVTAEDNLSVVCGQGTDSSVLEMWPALTAGASIVVADETVPRTAEGLAEWFEAVGATIAVLPTRFGEGLLGLPADAQPGLRSLIVGGDPLYIRPSEDLPYEVVNAYGPTEATVMVSSHTATAEGGGSVPIGSPIDNTRLYVLDGAGRPVPVGVPGELYIAGGCLASGYLNAESLTGQRFPVDGAGQRYYRTGDLARWRNDGVLEFRGRVADQVPLGGVPVDPGEVAGVLRAHAGVDDAAVIAMRGPDGSPYLAAFIVGDADADLSNVFPPHMSPHTWTRLDSLPYDLTGRIDREALIRLAPALSTGDSPSTTTTRDETPQKDTKPTTPAPSTVDNPVDNPGEGPLTIVQRRMTGFLKELGANLNIAVPVDLSGPLDTTLLKSALVTLAERHESLRSRFVERDGGVWAQEVLADPEGRLKLLDLTALPEAQRPERAEHHAEEARSTSFVLADGHAWRAVLIRLSEQDWRLVLVFHHLLADDWTRWLFLTELAELYSAAVDGREPTLPPVTQAIAYARSEHEPDPENRLAYWTDRIGDAALTVTLPYDRPDSRSANRACQEVELPSTVVEAAADLARRQETTPYAVYAAALGVFLSKLADTDHLILRTQHADRDDPRARTVMASLAASAALELDLRDDIDFATLVARTGNDHAEGIANRVTFPRLFTAVRERRGQTPGDVVQFLFPGAYATELDMPGITATFDNTPVHILPSTTFMCVPGTNGWWLALLHSPEQLDAETAAAWIDTYATVLEQLCADPDTPIGDL